MPFGRSQVVLNKQGALRKEVPNVLLSSLLVADSVLGCRRGRTPAFERWLACGEVFGDRALAFCEKVAGGHQDGAAGGCGRGRPLR